MKSVKTFAEESQSLPTSQCGPESCSMRHLDTEISAITFQPLNPDVLEALPPCPLTLLRQVIMYQRVALNSLNWLCSHFKNNLKHSILLPLSVGCCDYRWAPQCLVKAVLGNKHSASSMLGNILPTVWHLQLIFSEKNLSTCFQKVLCTRNFMKLFDFSFRGLFHVQTKTRWC